MDNFNELKSLWQQTESKRLPSAADLVLAVEQTRKKMLLKNILGGVSLSLTFFIIAFIGLYYDFQLWTTRIGIMITLLSICLGIFFNSSLAKLLLKKPSAIADNKSYLDQLKQIRKKQHQYQTTGISAYFLLLSLGIYLYMYEFARRDVMFGIIIYSVTTAWFAFNWFYTRKKAIAKQELQINMQIETIEKLMVELAKG